MSKLSIRVNEIKTKENCRFQIREEALLELMGSMKANTLLQPIGVRKSGSGYEVVYGNRRLEAARKLGWDKIDATLIHAESNEQVNILNLTENLIREDITFSEEGRHYTLLMESGMTIKEIAVRVNLKERRVRLAVGAYKELPEELRKRIKFNTKGNSSKKDGHIGTSIVQEILNMKKSFRLSQQETRDLFDFFEKEKVTISQLRLAAPLLKQGFSVKDAISKIDTLQTVSLMVQIPRKTVTQLEKLTGTRITEQIIKFLAEQSHFKVVDRTGFRKSMNAKLKKDSLQGTLRV